MAFNLKRGLSGGFKALGAYVGSEIEGDRKSARDERLAKIRHDYRSIEAGQTFDYNTTLEGMRIGGKEKAAGQAQTDRLQQIEQSNVIWQELDQLDIEPGTELWYEKSAELHNLARQKTDNVPARVAEIEHFIDKDLGGDRSPAGYAEARYMTQRGRKSIYEMALAHAMTMWDIQSKDISLKEGHSAYKSFDVMQREALPLFKQMKEKTISRPPRKPSRTYQQPGTGREPIQHTGATDFYNTGA